MLTSAQIAQKINGELKGSPDLTIKAFNEPLAARDEETISLVVDKKVIKQLAEVKAGLLVVKDFLETDKSQIKVQDPRMALVTLLNIFFPEEPEFPVQVSDRAYVSESADIGQNVTIMPFAYIGENVTIGDNTVIHPNVFVGRDAKIGSDCLLYANVSINRGCKLGDRVIIHSGTVIGSDGYGFIPQQDSPAQKIPQKGIVVIEDDVEIQANTAIDRAVIFETRIAKGVKIDNLVHIAHNVTVGENTLIAGQVGIAGSSHVGKNNMFGGQVGISDHVNVGDGNIMLGKCLVSKDLGDGKVVQGSPARDHKENLQREAMISKMLRKQQK